MRFCPWCLRKLAHAKYSLLLSTHQIPPAAGAGYIEENGACSSCGREMNVFVNACAACGQPGVEPVHGFRCPVANAKEREILEAMIKSAGECQDDDGDAEPPLPPARVFRGGLPSLGKKR